MPKNKNSTTGKPPLYMTESQLPINSEVKLHEHSNHIAARTETRKNGQDLRSHLEQGKIKPSVKGRK
jgi:hypothetical protein